MADKNGPEIRRKLYRRGSSFETTIPMPMLFQLDMSKKHNVVFRLDKKLNRWFIDFEEERSKRPGKR